MTITFDQIKRYEERLRGEIVQRECLMAAIKVFRAHVEKGEGLDSLELGPLASLLALPTRELTCEPLTPPASPIALAPPAPAPLPPVPPPERYINPELKALQTPCATETKAVRWAIQQMTEDYSMHDLNAFLNREGWGTSSATTSVVLSRLKRQGEIEEVQPGAGPHPAVYRGPAQPVAPEAKSSDPSGDAAITPDLVAAS